MHTTQKIANRARQCAGLVALILAVPAITSAVAESPTLLASDNKNDIVGKWKSVNSAEAMEFTADGTVIMTTSQPGSLVGRYSFIDDNRMKMQFPGWWGEGEPLLVGVKIEGRTLTLTMPDNKVTMFSRQ